ncbi:MAG: ring-opening amidohydrolase [Bradyrhizobium sp.]
MAVEILRFEMAAPDDTAELARMLQSLGSPNLKNLALAVKTEGTATINDFGRALALRAIEQCLADSGIGSGVPVQTIISTGSEGIIAPGGYLLAELDRGGVAGLAFGAARSEPVPPAEMMSVPAHGRIATRVVAEAMAKIGANPSDVALVLMKAPLLTRDEAVGLSPLYRERAGHSVLARGIAALGIGAALGEVEETALADDVLGRGTQLHSRRAMVFSGTETRRCEAIVLANQPGGPKPVRSGLIADLIDIDGMARILAPGASRPIAAARELARAGKIRAVFLKASIAPDGRLRGGRTTAFSSDLDPDKHMRAAASGALGALLGHGRFFVSGGAEHQAPPGGGVFAAVVAE